MKDIEGYKGVYAVSIEGGIWSYPKSWNTGINGIKGFTRKGRWLKQITNKKGYLMVRLSKSYVKGGGLVHRLVAKAFLPNPDNLPQVNHKNGIKTDNNVGNLEWSSNIDNMRHAFRIGLFKERDANRERDNKGRYKARNIATTKPPLRP